MNKELIKKYVFGFPNSNMYVIAENGSALVIDPNISNDALSYMISNSVDKVTVLLTHEHYDHTSGLAWLTSQLDCTVICHEQTAVSLKKGKNNRPALIALNKKEELPKERVMEVLRGLPQGFFCDPDITFTDDYVFEWEGHMIKMIACPGHSPGSCCIELDSDTVATGDSLILNTPVITRFPGGSEEEFRAKTLGYLEGLSDDTYILPGHGETFYMKEERQRHEKN